MCIRDSPSTVPELFRQMLSEFLQDTVHILYLFYIRQRFSGLSLHNRTVKQQKKILRLHPCLLYTSRFTECDGVGVLSKNAVTNMKYHFVITTAMITRLCKQNGMEMGQAFRLSDFYIQKLDGIHTVEELSLIHI